MVSLSFPLPKVAKTRVVSEYSCPSTSSLLPFTKISSLDICSIWVSYSICLGNFASELLSQGMPSRYQWTEYICSPEEKLDSSSIWLFHAFARACGQFPPPLPHWLNPWIYYLKKYLLTLCLGECVTNSAGQQHQAGQTFIRTDCLCAHKTVNICAKIFSKGVWSPLAFLGISWMYSNGNWKGVWDASGCRGTGQLTPLEQGCVQAEQFCKWGTEAQVALFWES